MKTKVKVKVVKEFMLPGQGAFQAGDEVTLYFGKPQSIGVLTRERYENLLERGSIEPIEKKEA